MLNSKGKYLLDSQEQVVPIENGFENFFPEIVSSN